MLRIAFSLILMLAISACAPIQSDKSQPETQDTSLPEPGESQVSAPELSTPPATSPEPGQAGTQSLPSKEQRLTAQPPGQIERVPEATQAFVTGEVPAEMLEAIQADIIDKLAKQPQTIELLQAVMTTWTDGSLGCPEAGMYYTQGFKNEISHPEDNESCK